MVLSSNWLNVRKSEDIKNEKDLKKTSNKKAKLSDKSRVIRVEKDVVVKKPYIQKKHGSKIMNMVEVMNKEMEKLDKERNLPKTEDYASSLKDKLNEDVSSKSLSRTEEVGKYVAIDCEFVGVGPEGKESALARVSIVNFYGNLVLDLYVKPKEFVTDWRTWVSGIKPHHMATAVSPEECQAKVANILKGRILVGHSLQHDLQALLLSHPRSMIRDTSRHLPFRQKYSSGKTPSLKKLTKEVLGIDIQASEHSSIEDARATMLLYKSDKKEFEKIHQQKFGNTK